jgi:hypothetical protein
MLHEMKFLCVESYLQLYNGKVVLGASCSICSTLNRSGGGQAKDWFIHTYRTEILKVASAEKSKSMKAPGSSESKRKPLKATTTTTNAKKSVWALAVMEMRQQTNDAATLLGAIASWWWWHIQSTAAMYGARALVSDALIQHTGMFVTETHIPGLLQA